MLFSSVLFLKHPPFCIFRRDRFYRKQILQKTKNLRLDLYTQNQICDLIITGIYVNRNGEQSDLL